MFELTISTGFDGQESISNLYKKLLPDIKNVSGITIKETNNGRSSVSLAVRREYSEFFKAKILDAIVDIIENEYKFNFFKEHLNFGSEKIIFNSYVARLGNLHKNQIHTK